MEEQKDQEKEGIFMDDDMQEKSRDAFYDEKRKKFEALNLIRQEKAKSQQVIINQYDRSTKM